MKIRSATIADIVNRGDSATLFEIMRTVIKNLNERTNELKMQRRTLAKVRQAFADAQSDRDRIFRIALDLKELCEENGLGEKAANITNKRGGLLGHDDGRVGEMVIELE